MTTYFLLLLHAVTTRYTTVPINAMATSINPHFNMFMKNATNKMAMAITTVIAMLFTDLPFATVTTFCPALFVCCVLSAIYIQQRKKHLMMVTVKEQVDM